MAKSKKKLVFVLLCIVVLFFGGYKIFNKNNNPLSTETIVSNVKSGKVSMPYINPAWEEYMELSDEEKENVENVPEKYIYKYVPTEDMYGEYNNLPVQYNLRDNYATTIYDQHGEGLCWSYATTTMLESNLKRTQNIDAQFSQKQLDMLTLEINKYLNNYNPYNLKREELGSGMYMGLQPTFDNIVLATGIIPVLNEKYTYSQENNIDISKVTDKELIDYTITETVSFPEYENTTEYKNMLKSFIMKYGAVKFSTYWPVDRPRTEYNITEKSEDSSGHFLSIVGWDDEYDFGDGKKGAWIIQNSWYNDHGDNMYYYYYGLPKDMIDNLMGVKTIVEKDWDNVYNYSEEPSIKCSGLEIMQGEPWREGSDLSLVKAANSNAVLGEMVISYSKSSRKNEKINMINFISASQGSTYKISISPDGNQDSFQSVKEIKTDMPGIYTVKFDNDIMLENDSFAIKIQTNDGAFYKYVNVFTNNHGQTDIGENKSIESISNLIGKNRDCDYEYSIITYANNISNGSLISYELYDNEQNKIEDNISPKVSVLNGKAVNTLIIPTTTQIGTKYIVKIEYKDTENNQTLSEDLEVIYNPGVYIGNMSGEGTEKNPYEIKTVEQLSLISDIPSAHYKLMNDIDLTMNKNEEKTYNHGTGWIPLKKFSGVLDGNGHTIKNLTIDSEMLGSYVGFFEKLEGATVKNIKFENASITELAEINKEDIYVDVGIVAGFAHNTKFQNIMVTGKIKAAKNNNTYAGMLVGRDMYDTVYKDIVIIGNIDSGKGGYIAGEGPIKIENAVIDVSMNADKKEEVLCIYHSRFDSTANMRYDNVYLIGEKQGVTDTEFSWDKMWSASGRHIYLYNENRIDLDISLASPDLSEFKNISLEESWFDTDLWEYTQNNPYPTLKMFPFKYDSDAIEPYIINKYTVNEDRKIIDNILPTTIEHYKENVNLQEPYTAKVFKSEEEVTEGNIASGMITKIYLNGESVAEYTNIVPGDVDGDGKISSIDVSKVGQYLEGLNIINEQNKSYILLAMDFTRDGKVTQNDKEDIQKYVVGILKRIEEEYYGLIEPYKINKYNSDEEKKTISNIFPTTIEHYKENINIQNPYTIKVFHGKEEVTEGNIATGMITKIYLNDEILAEYTNIVPGDVYADGKVSARDAGMIYQYFVGMLENFYGTPQYYAMDFSRDGKVRLNDAELIKRYGVKLYEPSEEDYYGENN